MKLKLFSVMVATFILATEQKAQVSNYSFTQTLGSYGPANTGTLVGTSLQDDDVTTANLPFPFVYNGITFNSIEVCSNGYLSFGSLTGIEYTPVSDNATQMLISPFGQDLFMGTVVFGDLATGSNTISNCSSVVGYSVGDVLFDYSNDFSSTNPTITAISGNDIVVNVNSTNSMSGYDVVNFHGYIKQNVSGTAPNRICEFEYRNFCRYAVYDENINFKVKFFETSNRIEFVYGGMIVGQDFFSSEVGLKGSNNLDFKTRKVTAPTTWNNSVASTLITDVCDFDPSTFPVSGQIYNWTPNGCSTPVITLSSNQITICNGQSAVITASGATTYTWNTGATTASILVTPSSNTNYSVSAGSSTCIATAVASVVVSPCTGIEGVYAGQNQLTAYPNPFHNELKFSNSSNEAVNINISDAQGKKVYNLQLNAGAEETINTEFLSPGFYMVNSSSGSAQISKKFIKE